MDVAHPEPLGLVSFWPRCVFVVQDLCEKFRSLDDETLRELQVRISPVDQRPEVECFTDYIVDFLEVSYFWGVIQSS